MSIGDCGGVYSGVVDVVCGDVGVVVGCNCGVSGGGSSALGYSCIV